ncbi:hypothetical protein [Streptomyces sp. NPDC002644]
MSKPKPFAVETHPLAVLRKVANETLRAEEDAATTKVGRLARQHRNARRTALRWALNVLVTGDADEVPGDALEGFLEAYSASPIYPGPPYERHKRAALYDGENYVS